MLAQPEKTTKPAALGQRACLTGFKTPWSALFPRLYFRGFCSSYRARVATTGKDSHPEPQRKPDQYIFFGSIWLRRRL